MKSVKKITIYSLFILLFFITFNIYFFIYFYLLSLPFTLLHIFFIFVFSFSYFLILNFLRNKVWYILSNLFLLLFFLFSLLNFVYFKVFSNFFNLTFDRIKQVNNGMVGLLKNFYILIPKELYFTFIIVFLSAIFISILYFKLFKFKKPQKVLFNNKSYKIKFNKKRKIKYITIPFLLFFIINLYTFKIVNYLYENPKDNWYHAKEQIIDLGFLGNFYTQVYAKESNSIKEIEEIKVLTNLEKTKKLYNDLYYIQNFKNNNINERPHFLEKPNVLIVQLESVSDWAIDSIANPMPFLKSLRENNISTSKFHANSCKTVNAEFTSLCSFLPNSLETVDFSHIDNDFNCLPSILKDKYNYNTHIFHANIPEFYSRDKLMPKWGFENSHFYPELEQGEADIDVYNKAIDLMIKEEKPFFTYLISYTTHSPHTQEMIDVFREQRGLEITYYSGKMESEYIEMIKNWGLYPEEVIRGYLGFLEAEDKALQELFNKLEENKLLDNTIVVIYGDHRYYSFFENDVEGFYNFHDIPFTIVMPDKQKFKQKNASHLDIAPTLFDLISNGEEKPKNFLGNSLYDKDFPNNIINKCLGDIYYINNDLIIKGNKKLNIYNIFHKYISLDKDKEDEYIDLLRHFIKRSDITIHTNTLNK